MPLTKNRPHHWFNPKPLDERSPDDALHPYQSKICTVLRQTRSFAGAAHILHLPLAKVVHHTLEIIKILTPWAPSNDPMLYVRVVLPCELWCPRAHVLWPLQLQVPNHPGLFPPGLTEAQRTILNGIHTSESAHSVRKKMQWGTVRYYKQISELTTLLGPIVMNLYREEAKQRRWLRRPEHWEGVEINGKRVEHEDDTTAIIDCFLRSPFSEKCSCGSGHSLRLADIPVTTGLGMSIETTVSPFGPARQIIGWACAYCWCVATAQGAILPHPALLSPPIRYSIGAPKRTPDPTVPYRVPIFDVGPGSPPPPSVMRTVEECLRFA